MELKGYQTRALDTLRSFLSEARVRGAAAAYAMLTAEPELAKRLRGYTGAYRPLNGMESTPYVCLRLPTGGGKTLLAAHTIGVAREAWIERDHPLVLWLVPSTTIRKQTVEALQSPRHAYRAALDAAFGGRVRVFDVSEFEQLLPHELRSRTCIVVATIQSLRTTSTEGRRLYAHNENLELHFAGVPRQAAGLQLVSDDKPGAGTIRYSFANLCHLHRPLMIVDEAHGAVTGLSREMQARVNPSAVIEFTATPRANSNILYSVSAQELKDEQMIKLPVMLSEHPDWQAAVTGAIAKREELAKLARREKEYLRPIVLFQAQPRDEAVTVEVLRRHLIDVEGIDERRIAVVYGDQRQLDAIDLFSPDCRIDFVITVEALKEGWDCSFAYVFCSVANIRSATDAEQLLGRVLRMPYAARRAAPALNRAYANLTSKSFAEAATSLKDRLVAMGFEEGEAEDNIQPQQQALDDGLWSRRARPRPSLAVSVPIEPEAAAAIVASVPGKITTTPTHRGVTITVTGFLTPAERERLVEALPAPVAATVREEVARYEAEHGHVPSPAERGERFVVPALTAEVQGELTLADTDLLMEHHDWSLSDHDARLVPGEFAITHTADTFEIDIDGDALFLRHSDQSAQAMLDVSVEGWTEQGLVLFLDRELRDPSIGQGDLIRWLTDAVGHLTGPRAIPLSALMQAKFALARRLKAKVAGIKADERRGMYQRSLFAPEAKPGVSFADGFEFRDGMFADVRRYGGGWRFNRHFLGWDKVPAFDGLLANGEGEEFDCARIIDSLPEVEYWVRNVSQHPDAFRLPLATGSFYPDFVVKLKDGRLLIVEYKGAHLAGDYSDEKRAVGALWEQVNRDGLFLMVEKTVDGRDMRAQLLRKLGAP